MNPRPLGYEPNDTRFSRPATSHLTCRKILRTSPTLRRVSPVPWRLVSESVSNRKALTHGFVSGANAVDAIDRDQIILDHVHDPVLTHA